MRASSYREEFATVYMAAIGAYPMDRDDVVAYLAPLVGGEFSAGYPTLRVLQVTPERDEFDGFVIVGGPYDGVDVTSGGRQYLTAVTWNVRRRGGEAVTTESLGPLRERWRAARRAGDVTLGGLELVNWSIKPYGELLSGYRGVPQIPALPAQRAAKAPAVATTTTPTNKRPWWVLIPLAALTFAGMQ